MKYEQYNCWKPQKIRFHKNEFVFTVVEDDYGYIEITITKVNPHVYMFIPQPLNVPYIKWKKQPAWKRLLVSLRDYYDRVKAHDDDK